GGEYYDGAARLAALPASRTMAAAQHGSGPAAEPGGSQDDVHPICRRTPTFNGRSTTDSAGKGRSLPTISPLGERSTPVAGRSADLFDGKFDEAPPLPRAY